MKILIIADGYPTKKNLTCGLFVKQQVDELREICSDCLFDVYYNPFFRWFNDPFNKRGLFWVSIKWLLQLVCFLPYLFRSYDLVHVHRFSLPVINGISYKLFHRVPLVFSSHSIRQVEKRYHRSWLKRAFHYFDLIIAMNHQMRRDFISFFDLSPEKVVTRSCGINFREFDENLPQTPSAHDGIVLGFVGNYSHNKRPLMFLKAIEKLKNRYRIRGVMIGGGRLSGEISKTINEKELPVKLYQSMSHTELIAHYAGLDLFIFPSASETFGIVGIEALYSGVPVISSAVGGKIDYIKNGVNGLLFEKDNLEEMISKIKYCLDNPHKLNEMKKEARPSVTTYSNREIALEIESYYKNLMSK